MLPKLLYAAFLPAALLGARAYYSRPAVNAVASQEQPGPEIAQPAGWVAFEADMEITNAGPNTKRVLGKFYRSSDGSTRRESWGAENSAFRVISIKNFVERSRYLKTPASEQWKKFPLEESTLPLRYRTNQHIKEHVERIEGYNTYRMTMSKGDTRILAPDLNFFPLIWQEIKSGRREVYTNIVRREPDASLFVPPPDAQVEPGNQQARDPLNPFARGTATLPGNHQAK